ncbi:putative periplasmic protein (plasmid) [Rhodovulum sp. P5]|nr:putative periplasmic protein [Rhodovulum sp. P5]
MAVLGVQACIAALLVAMDLFSALPKPGFPTSPGPTGPSVRPYTPDRHPASPDAPRGRPMADRLTFDGTGARLHLTGKIAPGDAERLMLELSRREHEGTPVRVLDLDSTGGSVHDALAIGRALRAGEIDTEVVDGAICFSACPYIFAGGVARRVEAGGRLGVHQHYFGENTFLPAFMAVKDIQRGQADVMAHLRAMGVDPALMEPAMRTPPEEIYVLDRQELTEFRLVTSAE